MNRLGELLETVPTGYSGTQVAAPSQGIHLECPGSASTSFLRQAMPTSLTSKRGLVLGGVWVVVGVYAWTSLDQGWIPHDEGTLGLSADRVMNGLLPHVDYDEVYTGGLAMMGALAFKIFGVDLFSLRLVLFAGFLAWVPVVYWLARRFSTPGLAAIVTLLAAAWSIPNYPAAMPSWFNLFLAGFAVACLFRYLETKRSAWLFGAGVSAGFSILIKIVGLYLVAGCLLSLAFLGRPEVDHPRAGGRAGNQVFFWATLVGAVSLTLLVWALVSRAPGPAVFGHFVIPVAVLCFWLVITERHLPPANMSARIRGFTSVFAPFLAGLAVPIALFLIPYVLAGGLGDLYRGLFEDPALRVVFASRPPPSLITTIMVIPTLLVLLLPSSPRNNHRLWFAVCLSLIGGVILCLGERIPVYRWVWLSIQNSIPVVILCGIAILGAARVRAKRLDPGLGSSRANRPPSREIQATILLFVTGLMSLVQYPFHSPIYFFYVGPMVVLTTLALVAGRGGRVSDPRDRGAAPRVGISQEPVFSVLLVFFLGFAVFWFHPGSVYNLGWAHVPVAQNQSFDLPRASIRVTEEEKVVYESLVEEISQHLNGGSLLAFPDAPEVYFLNGVLSPRRSTFEFFDDEEGEGGDPLVQVDSLNVSVIALNSQPHFSPPIEGELESELENRFPEERRIGKFIVRWRR